MLTLFMMVGLVGSGKSSYAVQLAEEESATIISSDALREELLGDIEDQSENGKIFNILHQRIVNTLKSGQSVIIDATNIKRKNRAAIFNVLHNNKIDCLKVAVLVATPYGICVKRNNSRERVVPVPVIDRQHRQFEIPEISEGFNYVMVKWDESYKDHNIEHLFNRLDIEQDNPYHTMTIGDHCLATRDAIKDGRLKVAAWLHDIGKEKAKTFTTRKGEPTDIAHYWNHENISAYDSLFYMKNLGSMNDETILYLASLIGHHMDMHNKNEKFQNGLRDRLGNKMYRDLKELHLADVAAK